MAKLKANLAAEPAPEPVVAKPAEPAPAPVKPAEPEKPDPATDRGLRAIEQQKKRWLDEQQAKETDYQVRIAKLAEREKQTDGKLASREELKKLSPTELLDILDHYGEDDHDILSRAAYARTKAGKTDPRAQAAAQEASRAQGSRATDAKVVELEAKYEAKFQELRDEFKRRDQRSFAEHWVSEAPKAIPADKPTFAGRLHTNDPETAKREFLSVGIDLEKANGGEQPTYDEVIAEIDKRDRAWLKSRGFDADALLAPPKPAPAPAAKPAPARTLDVTASNITRAEDEPKTRAERTARAIANLRARQRATADQT
jgi:hypothetical protein